MAFPRKLLNASEEVVLDLRPHWAELVLPVLAVLAAVVLAVLLQALTENDPVTLATAALIVAALVWFGVRYARWATTNFVVTTDRLIFRKGVIAKHGIEIPLDRVNNVISRQTVWERLMGSGDLLIESGGESGQQRFSNIRRPSSVQNEIHVQMEANENRKFDRVRGVGVPGVASGPPSIPQQIEELDQLRRRGLISDREFQAKKAQLLERM